MSIRIFKDHGSYYWDIGMNAQNENKSRLRNGVGVMCRGWGGAFIWGVWSGLCYLKRGECVDGISSQPMDHWNNNHVNGSQVTPTAWGIGLLTTSKKEWRRGAWYLVFWSLMPYRSNRPPSALCGFHQHKLMLWVFGCVFWVGMEGSHSALFTLVVGVCMWVCKWKSECVCLIDQGQYWLVNMMQSYYPYP